MFRPIRFALRVLAITAVPFLLIAPASFGQVASLSGETFETTPALGQQTTFGPYDCDKNGTTVIPFQTDGAALGPYLGTFTETGTVTIGPQTDFTFDSRGTGPVTGFQASFTITSQVPTGTVTGTKQLAPTQPPADTHQAVGLCNPDGASTPDTDVFVVVSDPFVLYTAQINALTGTRADSGTSSFAIETDPSGTATFQESFTSTESECEDGNNGNGNGEGHPKKNKDNDDDEHCE
jgi:hypothetical protein